MFVKVTWYIAAWASEIEESGIAPRQVAGQPLVMMRASNGEIIALEDRCSHRMAPLSKGRREGDAIRCMYHGLKFDCTGTCIEVGPLACAS
ncbi:MAG: Rieske 2Fe-2S domain-containing protein [Pseudomonadota bacterium]|nr:Rieske 2Fe-2S domain-containing protein [Pseudomonadota bacterium]